jgi:transposase-like protein
MGTDTHRDTICRLLVEVGEGCAKIMDERMRGVQSRRIQVDEIWTYVQKKQRHITREDDTRRVGDQWIFVALDPETKLVPAYRVGKRRRPDAVAFMADLSERLANRGQLSSDALTTYVDAVERPSVTISTTGRRLNFTKQSRLAQAVTALPRL